MIASPEWSVSDLDAAREAAEQAFRDKRQAESQEMCLKLFDAYKGVVKEVLEQTLDLSGLDHAGPALLGEERKQEVLRYLCGPPLSADDLKLLVKAKSLDPTRLGEGADRVDRLMSVVKRWHDRRRFPWVEAGRAATESEKQVAITATTALLAMRRTETLRRTHGSEAQELAVAEALLDAGFEQVGTRRVTTLSEAPMPRQFCRESLLGSRKADFVIGLLDRRTMAIECKVSSTAVNSIKRLNNDAAAKASTWRSEFGTSQVVPAAVLEGVYALINLVDAQDRGLAIFWAHDLDSMIEWIQSTARM